MADNQKPEEKKPKKKPEGLVIPTKQPKLSKAERRALQEQQRAAKAARQQQQGKEKEGARSYPNPPFQEEEFLLQYEQWKDAVGQDTLQEEGITEETMRKTCELICTKFPRGTCRGQLLWEPIVDDTPLEHRGVSMNWLNKVRGWMMKNLQTDGPIIPTRLFVSLFVEPLVLQPTQQQKEENTEETHLPWEDLQSDFAKVVEQEAAKKVIQFLKENAAKGCNKNSKGEDTDSATKGQQSSKEEQRCFVSLPPIQDKDKRRQVHQWIKSSGLHSIATVDMTEDGQGNKVIRFWPLRQETKKVLPLYYFVPIEFRGKPQVFMSHGWDSWLRHLLFLPKSSVPGQLAVKKSSQKTFLWLDIFAIVQDPGSVKQQSEVAQIGEVVQSIGQTCLVIPGHGCHQFALLPARRSWCCLEIAYTKNLSARVGLNKAFFATGGTGYSTENLFFHRLLIREIRQLKCSDAETRSADEKKAIQDVLDQKLGLERADRMVQRAILEAFNERYSGATKGSSLASMYRQALECLREETTS